MSSPAKPAQILAVDDDEGLLILMADALRSEGYHVATAGSGTAALAWLREHTPDLMLLDLKMKDVGGPALLKRLRREDAPVPFIVVTGQGDEKIAVDVMKQGALDYVMKDRGMLDLLPAVVRRALDSVEQDRVLAAAQAESRRFEAEIVDISERERRRIGEDLHDGLGQQLTAIELLCTALREDAVRARSDFVPDLDRMGSMLREAIAQTRFLARGLVPVGDDPDALRIGLAELAERIDSLGRIRCRLECSGSVAIGDRAVAGQLYRIGQEAVNNAVKHSGASEVVVRLSRHDAGIQLRISDNGLGMPSDRGRGMGVEVMKHRASLIQADLEIVGRKGQGVVVTCTWVPSP
jgi:signal transduction histidine kinase